jgi:hypothetical protein
MPAIQNSFNQVIATGRTMSAAFYNPTRQEWYEVLIPTTLGVYEVPAYNIFTGYQTLGGADLSDSQAGEIDGEPVVFFCSALPYRRWQISVYGEWPVIATFTLDPATDRWVYDQSKSMFLSDFGTQDPAHWVPSFNTFGETVYQTRGLGEMAWLPASQTLACVGYFPMAGRRSGDIFVVDPATKEQVAYFVWPNMQTKQGTLISGFPRDIKSDPTGTYGSEVFNVVSDQFYAPNEVLQVNINASAGSWTLSYNGNTTAGISYDSEDNDVALAIAALPGIGVGNVEVTTTSPFLLATNRVHRVEFIAGLAATNLGTFTFNGGSLTSVGGGSTYSVLQQGDPSGKVQFPFTSVEFSFDATTNEISMLTVPYLPFAGLEVLSDRAEAYPFRYSNVHYTSNGDLVLASNFNLNGFTSGDVHIFRAVAGVRALDTAIPPTSGWENRVGEARIAADFVSPAAGRGTAVAPAIRDDSGTTEIIIGTLNGNFNKLTPTGEWATTQLLPNPTFATNATGWEASAFNTATWESGDSGRLKLTAGSGATSYILRTSTGTQGIDVSSSVGKELQGRISVKCGTSRAMVRPFFTYYNSAGSVVSFLLGYGPKGWVETTDYRTFHWATEVPVGTQYLAINVEFFDAAIADDFYLAEATVTTPPYEVSNRSWDATTLGNDWISGMGYDPVTRQAHMASRSLVGGVYNDMIITAHLDRM